MASLEPEARRNDGHVLKVGEALPTPSVREGGSLAGKLSCGVVSIADLLMRRDEIDAAGRIVFAFWFAHITSSSVFPLSP